MDDRRKRATYAAICFGTIAFALAFVAPGWAEQAVPWYDPLARTWAWEVRPTGLAMDFYGRGLLATIAALPVAALAFVLARFVRSPGDRALGLFLAWAMTATLLAMLHFTWALSFRHPMPVYPVPDWYQPR